MLEEYSDNLAEFEIFPSGKIFRISFDSTVGKMKILAKDHSVFQQLRDAFSAENTNAFFVKQYGYAAAQKNYAINKFGYFSSGLLWEILKWIKNNYLDLSVLIISKKCKSYIDEQLTPLKSFVKSLDHEFEVVNIAEDSGRNNEMKRSSDRSFDYRDYQLNSIKELICTGYGRGLIEIPTAGGKSFILANFCWNLHKQYDRNLKYLLLVPNKQLVNQMHSDFIDYGYSKYNVTRFTAGLKKNEAFNPDAQIIVANRQYIFKNMDKLPKIDVLICDEVHTCLAESTMNFIENLNCKIKVGCSGTLPRDKFSLWKMLGMFSKIVYKEEITDLQKRGFISKLKITSIQIVDTLVESNRNCLFHTNSLIKYKPDEFGQSEIRFDDASKAEIEYYNKHYFELYKPVLEYVTKLESNTLILFDRLEFGKNIYAAAINEYATKKFFYIDGATDVNEREKIRFGFEQSDGNVLVAQTTVFSTGINIKRLTNIVFLTGSKSFSQVLQSIGRTLRLHKDKEYAHLIDVSFNFKYSQRHYQERLKIYKQAYHKLPDETLQFSI